MSRRSSPATPFCAIRKGAIKKHDIIQLFYEEEKTRGLLTLTMIVTRKLSVYENPLNPKPNTSTGKSRIWFCLISL
jgi:hypothetical protein